MSQPSENPTFKLQYFNVRGLAEAIRMLFAYGGINYEDVRVPHANWPALKSTMPMGQMPVLEVDGHRVHQSTSIARYLAKRVGLAGSNDWESLLIDIAVDTVNDFRLKLIAAHFETDAAVKEKKFADLKKDVIPFYLEKLDAIAKKNNGHLALGRLTWADVFFVAILDTLNFIVGSDLTENHSNLKLVADNVKSIDSIKAWIAKRPKSDL